MEELFKRIGGEFLTPFSAISEKHKNIKAYLFDWDGVFNTGVKGESINSPFYEADSMGINLLRFSYWLKHRELPLSSIITGENNISAFHFAHREHFQSVYYSFKNKATALDHLYKIYGINSDQVAYVFDDVLDIAIARQCGLRFLIRREASPLFTQYVKKNNLCDYITGSSSSDFAIREVSELIISLTGDFDNVVNERIVFSYNYEEYLNERNSVIPSFWTLDGGDIIKKDIK